MSDSDGGLPVRRDPWAGHTDPGRWTTSHDDHEANWTDDERKFVAKLSPARQHLRPYSVTIALVAGPNLIGNGRRSRVHISGHMMDWVLLGDRYPVCSCHGHPWPCQDADRDRVAAMQARVMEREIARALPGLCPACGEPITARQKTITYPGENLNVPGGPEPTFHLRRFCYHEATQYELRWIAAGPRRERILTWPDCPGTLVVHYDGSSECRRGVPDCRGHLTHDHRTRGACYGFSGCSRGCVREGHPGCRTTPRPPRPTANQGSLL